jgi:diaminopimelate decarboxylase
VALVTDLASDGIQLHHVDIGGGLGVDYGKGDTVPSPANTARAVRSALAPLAALGLTLYTEPGRVIVGQAGALVTSVVFRKRNEAKPSDRRRGDERSDAARAVRIVPPDEAGGEAGRTNIVTDVVGPICETGDFFARDRALPEFAQGELIAIGAAGAYTASMASNYNTRPRAPEVLVRGDRYTVIRPRNLRATARGRTDRSMASRLTDILARWALRVRAARECVRR